MRAIPERKYHSGTLTLAASRAGAGAIIAYVRLYRCGTKYCFGMRRVRRTFDRRRVKALTKKVMPVESPGKARPFGIAAKPQPWCDDGCSSGGDRWMKAQAMRPWGGMRRTVKVSRPYCRTLRYSRRRSTCSS